jgi:hypothetical protein
VHVINSLDYIGCDYKECCCWKVKMVEHGSTMCIIVDCVVFSMWLAKLTHP